jgi:transcriptional regulator with XRE-family HTH domain
MSTNPLPETTYEKIVQVLIDRRQELDWTQEQLAHKIGCDRSLIYRWERMKRRPSGFMFECWLEALNLEISIKNKQCSKSEM